MQRSQRTKKVPRKKPSSVALKARPSKRRKQHTSKQSSRTPVTTTTVTTTKTVTSTKDKADVETTVDTVKSNINNKKNLLLRFKDAVDAYQRMVNSVPVHTIPTSLSDVPDTLLTPQTPSEIQATTQWLTRATNTIANLKSRQSVAMTGRNFIPQQHSTTFGFAPAVSMQKFIPFNSQFKMKDLQERLNQAKQALENARADQPTSNSQREQPHPPPVPGTGSQAQGTGSQAQGTGSQAQGTGSQAQGTGSQDQGPEDDVTSGGRRPGIPGPVQTPEMDVDGGLDNAPELDSESEPTVPSEEQMRGITSPSPVNEYQEKINRLVSQQEWGRDRTSKEIVDIMMNIIRQVIEEGLENEGWPEESIDATSGADPNQIRLNRIAELVTTYYRSFFSFERTIEVFEESANIGKDDEMQEFIQAIKKMIEFFYRYDVNPDSYGRRAGLALDIVALLSVVKSYYLDIMPTPLMREQVTQFEEDLTLLTSQLKTIWETEFMSGESQRQKHSQA